MFPPVFTLPHGVSRADIIQTGERGIVRRSAPERLRIEPHLSGPSVVPLAPLVLDAAPRPTPPREQGWLSRLWRRPVLAPQV